LEPGYDTTAQTLAYAGYELAKNPEIQKHLQDEIDVAYEDANGEEPDYAVVQVSQY
jgi:cytochrome P450